jgi:hypothetical protein
MRKPKRKSKLSPAEQTRRRIAGERRAITNERLIVLAAETNAELTAIGRAYMVAREAQGRYSDALAARSITPSLAGLGTLAAAKGRLDDAEHILEGLYQKQVARERR